MNKQSQPTTDKQQDIQSSILFTSDQAHHELKIDFPFGLPGFEMFSKYVISDLPEYPPFCMLQSVEAVDISMLVIEARMLNIHSEIDIPLKEMKKVGIQDVNEAVVLFILKVNHQTHELTANVRAPLVINKELKTGFQAILEDPDLPLEYPLSEGLS